MCRYSKPAVSASKEEQVNNPVFKDGPKPFLDQYRELASDISVVAAEINGTLDSILCLDDEECFSAPIYDCEAYEPEPITYISSSGDGSGSGSGSGKAMDDGLRDMEDGDSSGDANDDDDIFPTPTPTPTILDSDTSYNITSVGSGDDGYSVIDIPTSRGIVTTTTTTSDPSPPAVVPDVDDVHTSQLVGGTPTVHRNTLQLGLSFCLSLVLVKLH